MRTELEQKAFAAGWLWIIAAEAAAGTAAESVQRQAEREAFYAYQKAAKLAESKEEEEYVSPHEIAAAARQFSR